MTFSMTFSMTFLTNWIRTHPRTVASLATVVAVTVAYKRYTGRRTQQVQVIMPVDAFETRFLKEYDQMKDDPDAPVPPSHAHVRETTPQGDVIMSYDADREMFCYYCDKRSVQFKYLEPLARKYVVEHGCKRLYVDIRQTTKAAQPVTATAAIPVTAAQPATQSAPVVTTKSVFAQLKKYGGKPPPVPLKEQVTRYWYCGNLNEFAKEASSDAHDFSIIKPIDYASYKKMSSSP
jgi:hypothetical protein